MNAKPILLALVVCGCAAGSPAADAQDLVEYALPVKLVPPSPVTVAFEFECTLAFKDGVQKSPVTVKATSPEEAQRNAILLATPTGAICKPQLSRSTN